MHWENNYFEIHGEESNLKIKQKVSGSVVAPRYLGNYLLLEMKRTDGNIHLEFPRGFQKENEGFLSTALRVLEEKTNLKPNISLQLGKIMPDSGLLDTKIESYLTEIEDLNDLNLAKDNRITNCKWVSFDELKKLVADGIIVDGFTISTICKIICSNSDKKISKLKL